jgi:hypothetical protein
MFFFNNSGERRMFQGSDGDAVVPGPVTVFPPLKGSSPVSAEESAFRVNVLAAKEKFISSSFISFPFNRREEEANRSVERTQPR